MRWAPSVALAGVLALDLLVMHHSPYAVGPLQRPMMHAAIGLGTSAAVYERDGAVRVVVVRSRGWSKEDMWPREGSGWVGQVDISAVHPEHYGLLSQCVTVHRTGMSMRVGRERVEVSPEVRAQVCAQLLEVPTSHGVRWDRMSPVLARGGTALWEVSWGWCLHDACMAWMACVLLVRAGVVMWTGLPGAVGVARA